MSLHLILFIAGLLTILLPCILPLIPIVLGVSIAGRSKLRPLFTVAGMLVSFVGFTFLLLVVLNQFVEVADYMRIGTYYILLLFGLGFVTHSRRIQMPGALVGGLFFLGKGWSAVAVAAITGVILMEIGGRIASRIQQFGAGIQQKTREGLGADNPVGAFVIGLTMGLVWVPCAGPALGFAFALVRDEPGLRALTALSAYGAGTAIPLLLIGYGGQAAVHSVHALARYSGRIKQIAGILLIATAVLFSLNLFKTIETWFVENTPFGNLGVDIEERLFDGTVEQGANTVSDSSPNSLMRLPQILRAPELTGLGPWHNSEPFTLESLRGKVVLVDFWTYSCINCIRTLPYIQEYWETYKDQPFVLIGVHTPEFVFEKSEANVADAIKRHGLTYPVAQDNDFKTWRAFANRYWPAKYLIDANGYIRYTHFGEGDYGETDTAIRSLLAEIGVQTEAGAIDMPEEDSRRDRSPETYLGARSWPALANGAAGPTDAVTTYEVPQDRLPLHSYALVGDWQLLNGEQHVLRSAEGEIRMHFLGGEINLVMGMEEFDAAETLPVVDVEVDGEHVQTFTIDKYDLFPLWKGAYGDHEIILRIKGRGAEAYAFTFGA